LSDQIRRLCARGNERITGAAVMRIDRFDHASTGEVSNAPV
jgi:hypothetical protein